MHGLISGLLGRLTGGDPVAAQAARNDPAILQALGDVELLKAVEEVLRDRSQLEKYEKRPDVLTLLSKVDVLCHRPAIANGDHDEDIPGRVPVTPPAQAPLSRVQAAIYDVKDWASMPWYARNSEIGKHLQQKGFCLLRGQISRAVREKAMEEALRLKAKGLFTRPPRETLAGYFGELGSAWIHRLGDPTKPANPGEEELRSLDTQLENLASEIGSCTQAYFGMILAGRLPGALHFSRAPEDAPNPALTDAREADELLALFMRKKIKIAYYMGPGPATMMISPIGSEMEAFRCQLQPDSLVVLRGDVCRCNISPKLADPGLTLEVDFLAEQRTGPQAIHGDRVLPPEELMEWYVGRLRAIVSNEVTANVPEDWLKIARHLFFKNRPLRILEVAFELPTISVDKWRSPFEAAALGGNDCISEIPLSKFDINAYFDPSPENAENLKLYTRHMGVLGSAYTPLEDELRQWFGKTGAEASQVAPEQVALWRGATSCLHSAGFDMAEPTGEELGLFVGVSTNDTFCKLIGAQSKLGKALAGSEQPKLDVDRLSYFLGTKGPTGAIDTDDSSGSAALDTAAANLRQVKCSKALVASTCLIQQPATLAVFCALKQMSKSGRCRVFDQSADGAVRSEGVVHLLLEPHGSWTRNINKEEMDADVECLEEDAEVESRGILSGTALGSYGTASRLTTLHGPAIREVVTQALQDAISPAAILDAVEVNAAGSPMQDGIEFGVMAACALGERDPKLGVVLRSLKSVLGETGAPAGLAAILRVCLGFEKAAHGPTIHFRQLLDAAAKSQEEGASEDEKRRLLIVTEAVDVRSTTQAAGVSSFGSSGTCIHHTLTGKRPQAKLLPSEGKPIHWFPSTAVPSLPPQPATFHIVGTWDAWHTPHQMEAEGDGVYGYTVTLGENCWEAFQIWIDADPDQVLHPDQHWSAKDGEVFGPTEQALCGRCHTWLLNGRNSKARLINEEQGKALGEKIGPVPKPPVVTDDDFIPNIVAFSGNFKPEEARSGVEGMPVVETNAGDVGVPGDQYRVRLHLRGKFRRVEWSKLASSSLTSVQEDDKWHAYHVTGDFNFWSFTEMDTLQEVPAASSKEGCYVAEVQLLRDGGRFQVVRDKDWDQTFYPKEPNADATAKVMGPDCCGLGKSWRLGGKAGDIFRVEFRRTTHPDGRDQRSISWKLVRTATVNFEALAKDHKYFVVGSWTNFKEVQEMKKEAGGTFSAEITIGSSGREYFQLLLNRNWQAAVYPSTTAAHFKDAGHKLCGPDERGFNSFWAIGSREDEPLAAGSRVSISLVVKSGWPAEVRWRAL